MELCKLHTIIRRDDFLHLSLRSVLILPFESRVPFEILNVPSVAGAFGCAALVQFFLGAASAVGATLMGTWAAGCSIALDMVCEGSSVGLAWTASSRADRYKV